MAAEEAVEHPYFQEVHSEFWSVSKSGIPIYKRLPIRWTDWCQFIFYHLISEVGPGGSSMDPCNMTIWAAE